MDDRLLVVDADAVLRARLSSYLQANGFQVVTVADGRESLRIAYEYHPQLVILGLDLPGLDGYQVCARLRELSDVPILMLTEGAEEEAVVACLGAGADDCLDEPLRMRELEARVRALLRRVRTAQHRHMPEYDDGRLRIDPERQLVWRSGSLVHLSPTEFRLLSTLLRRSGKVVSHEELLTEVWGSLYLDSPNYLSIYIRYIREKLEENPARPQYIQTKRGVGYCFVPHGVMAGYLTERKGSQTDSSASTGQSGA